MLSGTRQIRVNLYAKEPSFRYLGVRDMTPVMFPRKQLKRRGHPDRGRFRAAWQVPAPS